MIKVGKIELSGTVLARKFIPIISEEDYYLSILPPTTVNNLVRHHINNVEDVVYLDSLEQTIHNH